MAHHAPPETAPRMETETALTWLEPTGVAVQRLKAVRLELPHARVNFDALVSLTGGVPVPLLTDLTQLTYASPEVRQFYSGEEAAKAVRAVALVLASPVSKAIGNFFLSINQPVYPARMFASSADAMRWLLDNHLDG